MPRKQRFKPSRKPKPIPQTEDAVIGKEQSSAPEYRDDGGAAREVASDRAETSPTESEADQRQR